MVFEGSAFQAQLTRIETAVNGLATSLKTLNATLAALQQGDSKIVLSLQNLTDAVAAAKTVEDSAITLLNGLTTELQQLIAQSGNTVDPAALQAVVDGITAETQTLAAAVTANTPAQPPTPAPASTT